MKNLLLCVLYLLSAVCYGQFSKKATHADYSIDFTPADLPFFRLDYDVVTTVTSENMQSLSAYALVNHSVAEENNIRYSYPVNRRITLYTFDSFGNFKGTTVTITDHNKHARRKFRR